MIFENDLKQNSFFSDEVLKISDGIEYFGSIQFSVAFCLFLAWITVFAALSKGVQTLGKVSYFTATFPYLMLTILVIKGSLLDGAGYGIQFYIGSFDASKLTDPELWKDAVKYTIYFILNQFKSFLDSL